MSVGFPRHTRLWCLLNLLSRRLQPPRFEREWWRGTGYLVTVAARNALLNEIHGVLKDKFIKITRPQYFFSLWKGGN